MNYVYFHYTIPLILLIFICFILSSDVFVLGNKSFRRGFKKSGSSSIALAMSDRYDPVEELCRSQGHTITHNFPTDVSSSNAVVSKCRNVTRGDRDYNFLVYVLCYSDMTCGKANHLYGCFSW